MDEETEEPATIETQALDDDVRADWDALMAGAEEKDDPTSILESALQAKAKLKKADKARMLEMLQRHQAKQTGGQEAAKGLVKTTASCPHAVPGTAATEVPMPGACAVGEATAPPAPFQNSPSTRNGQHSRFPSKSCPRGAVRMPIKNRGRVPAPTPLGGTPLAAKLERRRNKPTEMDEKDIMSVEDTDEDSPILDLRGSGSVPEPPGNEE